MTRPVYMHCHGRTGSDEFVKIGWAEFSPDGGIRLVLEAIPRAPTWDIVILPSSRGIPTYSPVPGSMLPQPQLNPGDVAAPHVVGTSNNGR